MLQRLALRDSGNGGNGQLDPRKDSGVADSSFGDQGPDAIASGEDSGTVEGAGPHG